MVIKFVMKIVIHCERIWVYWNFWMCVSAEFFLSR